MMVDTNPFVEAIEDADDLRRQGAAAGWKRREAYAARRQSDELLGQLEELNLKGVTRTPDPLLLQFKRLASQCGVPERRLRWRKVQEALDDLFELQAKLLARCYNINSHLASLMEAEARQEEIMGDEDPLVALDAQEEAR